MQDDPLPAGCVDQRVEPFNLPLQPGPVIITRSRSIRTCHFPGYSSSSGLSTKVGHDGSILRRDDTYRLLIEEAGAYEGQLQVIAVDNDVPDFAAQSVALNLWHQLIALYVSGSMPELESGDG